MHISKATIQRVSIRLKGHLLYKKRYWELLAAVRELDEEMNGATTAWVVLRKDVQILEHA
jgi:hypothetical protein